ncbi:MAG: hypothetical protein GY795_12030 [Desulfobacterales bacterium]|nr:hypothetical protein [Desulfobacterales bacterium]
MKFEDGFIKYTVQHFENVDELPKEINSEWDDGYVSFSKTEKRFEKEDILSLLTQDDFTEIDLWRKGSDMYEEIAVEREDRGFFFQHWQLFTKEKQKPEGDNICRCYYRNAETVPRKPIETKAVFQDNQLNSIEVICPDNRLHFFITAGGN